MIKGKISSLLSDYGMILVLLILCAVFALTTFSEQPAEGSGAGQNMAFKVKNQQEVILVVTESNSDTQLRESFEENLKGSGGLDGLVACNDATAAELLVSLDSLGVKVPEKLKICAFDDVKYAKLLKTPLTTYRQPCRDIGTTAIETMISRIKNPGMSARKVLLHGELIVRDSTGG